MTVSTTTRYIRHIGNSAATSFAYDFKIGDSSEAVVVLEIISTGARTTLSSSQYTISGIGSAAGGSVEYPLSGSPIGSDKALVIYREVGYTQDLDISNQDGFLPEVIEAQLDDLEFQIQQIADNASRAIRAPIGRAFDGEVPAFTPGKIFAVNEDGTGAELINGTDASSTSVTVGSVARLLAQVLDDGGANVRDFGATDNANCTQAFLDAIAAIEEAASTHQYTYSGTWNKGYPSLIIPAGTYQVDLSGVTNGLWEPSGAAKRGLHIRGAGPDQVFIRIVGGSGKWLLYNNNNAMLTEMEGFSVYDETGNANGLMYMTSTGTAKRPRLRNVETFKMRVAELAGTGNSDHLRAQNVVAWKVPAGVSAYKINNSQSVDHQLIGCEWPELCGTGIEVLGGGTVKVDGGSMSIGLDGIGLKVSGAGAVIGAGNNQFHLDSLKVELRNIASGGAGLPPQFVYLNAAALVVLSEVIGETDELAASRVSGGGAGREPIEIRRGRVQVRDSSNWAYPIDVYANDNDNVQDLPSEFAVFASHLKKQLASLVTLNAPPSGGSKHASGARALARGCFGIADKVPRDVTLNLDRGQRSWSGGVVLHRFTGGNGAAGALPGSAAAFTFNVPVGAVVRRVGVRKAAGSGSTGAVYTIKDGDGNTLHTTGAINNADDVRDMSAEFNPPLLIDDATTGAFVLSCSTAATAEGYMIVEWEV